MKREIALCDKILGIFQLQFSKKKARQTYTTMSQLAFLVFVKITCHFYGGGKLKKTGVYVFTRLDVSIYEKDSL